MLGWMNKQIGVLLILNLEETLNISDVNSKTPASTAGTFPWDQEPFEELNFSTCI